MSLNLCAVSMRFQGANSAALANATVHCYLSGAAADPDQAVVVPQLITATTNANGECTVNLWPNARGLTGSRYTIMAGGTPPTAPVVTVHAVVPDLYSADLHDCLVSATGNSPTTGPVRSVNGLAPDASGDVQVQGTTAERDSATGVGIAGRPEASMARLGSRWRDLAGTTGYPEHACTGLSWRPTSARRDAAEPALETLLPLQAMWLADDLMQADGSAVVSWVDRIGGLVFSQTDSAKRPLYYRSTDARCINGRPVVTADGVDDLLHCSLNSLWPTARGSVFAVLRDNPSNTATHAVLLSSGINTAVNAWVYLGHTNAAVDPAYMTSQRNDDTEDRVTFGTVVAGSPQLVEWASTGGAYSLRLGNVPRPVTVVSGANKGDWFADTAGRSGATLFSRKTNGETRFWRGDLAALFVCARPLSDSERSRLTAWVRSRYALNL